MTRGLEKEKLDRAYSRNESLLSNLEFVHATRIVEATRRLHQRSLQAVAGARAASMMVQVMTGEVFLSDFCVHGRTRATWQQQAAFVEKRASE